jgi:hypothetical protein
MAGILKPLGIYIAGSECVNIHCLLVFAIGSIIPLPACKLSSPKVGADTGFFRLQTMVHVKKHDTCSCFKVKFIIYFLLFTFSDELCNL